MKLYQLLIFFSFSLFILSCDKDENDCINPNLIDLETAITLDYNPVCGCDGKTYSNEASATFHGGVTSWTDGPCNDDTPTCDSSTLFKVYNDPNCGLIAETLNGLKYEVNDVYGDISFFDGEHVAAYFTVSPQLGSCSGLYVINITGFCSYTDCIPMGYYDDFIVPGVGLPPYWEDDIHINSAWKEGNCLFLNVTYSGGCETHLFRLVQGLFFCGTPPYPDPVLHFDHQSFDDACDALITQTISFDISTVLYNPGASALIINTSDNQNNITIAL